MMDKNREAFEAWFNDPEKVDIREAYAWRVWQASRQAIEVELVDPDFWGDEPELQEFSDMTIKSLVALGIRVKGNEE